MKHSTIKCKLLPIFSYSVGTGYELFWIKLFFKSSFDITVGLPINNDKLLSWILSKGYAYPSNNRKYLCIIYYVHDCLSAVRNKESMQFLFPGSPG